MASEEVRSLSVALGFDIDLTGADRFEQRFRKLTGDVDKFGKKFETRTKGINKNLLGFGLTAGGAFLGAKKSYDKFTDALEAEREIKFRIGDQFNLVDKSIEKSIANTGNFIKRIDALNAISIGERLIGDQDFLTRNFETLIKLSGILKDTSLPDLTEQISSFIKSGGDLGLLERIKGITAEERESLTKAGADLSQQGMRNRQQLIERVFSQQAENINKQFTVASKENTIATEKLSASIDGLSIEIGQKLSPSLNKFQISLAESINKFTETLQEDGFFTALKEAVIGTPEELEASRKALGEETPFEKSLLGVLGAFWTRINQYDPQPIQRSPDFVPAVRGRFMQSAAQSASALQNQVFDTTVNATINVSGAQNPSTVAEEVMKKMNKSVVEHNQRLSTVQSVNGQR